MTSTTWASLIKKEDSLQYGSKDDYGVAVNRQEAGISCLCRLVYNTRWARNFEGSDSTPMRRGNR